MSIFLMVTDEEKPEDHVLMRTVIPQYTMLCMTMVSVLNVIVCVPRGDGVEGTDRPGRGPVMKTSR